MTGSKSSNSSIKCSVSACCHNNTSDHYCSLNEIKVGCCDPAVTDPSCTECASFKLNRK